VKELVDELVDELVGGPVLELVGGPVHEPVHGLGGTRPYPLTRADSIAPA
jgi:hypothetical protein